jgi:hypothetical protein
VYHAVDKDLVLVMINDITPADIEQGQLENLLNDAKDFVDPELV